MPKTDQDSARNSNPSDTSTKNFNTSGSVKGTSGKESDTYLANKVETMAKWIDDFRYRYARQWFINWSFYEGNHFVWWNQASNVVTPINPAPGRVLRAVPKTRKQVEAVNNMMMASSVRWEVIPEDDEKGDIEDVAKRVNHFLQDQWDHLRIRSKLDDLLMYGSYCPYSVIEAGWDSDKEDIYVTVRDAFDVLLPPCDDIEEAPFVIITYKETLENIKKNKAYKNTELVKESPMYAYSFFKEQRIESKLQGGQRQYEEYDETKSCIVKEGWYKVKGENGKTHIRLLVVADEQLLMDETYDQEDYPFVMYKSYPGDIYQPAFIEKFIPLNKSLDVLVSQVENFINLMVRGRYLQQKGSSFSRIHNEDGEIIQWDVAPPEAQPIPSIPGFVFNHIANIERWIEEQGVSTAALGKVPKGVKAYKAIESLKQTDFANLRIMVNNLQDTIEKLTEKILDLAAKNYLLPQTVYRMDNLGKNDKFKVIGESGAKLDINRSAMQGENAPVVISNKFRVKVL